MSLGVRASKWTFAKIVLVSSWAFRDDIPFIRAVRFVPAVMKQRLPAQYLKALDTTA